MSVLTSSLSPGPAVHFLKTLLSPVPPLRGLAVASLALLLPSPPPPTPSRPASASPLGLDLNQDPMDVLEGKKLDHGSQGEGRREGGGREWGEVEGEMVRVVEAPLFGSQFLSGLAADHLAPTAMGTQRGGGGFPSFSPSSNNFGMLMSLMSSPQAAASMLGSAAIVKVVSSSFASQNAPTPKWSLAPASSFDPTTAQLVYKLGALGAPLPRAFLAAVADPLTQAVKSADSGTQTAAAEVLAGLLRSASPPVLEAWASGAPGADSEGGGWLQALTRSAILGAGSVESSDEWLQCLRYALSVPAISTGTFTWEDPSVRGQQEPAGVGASREKETFAGEREGFAARSARMRSLLRDLVAERLPVGSSSALVSKRLLALSIATGELRIGGRHLSSGTEHPSRAVPNVGGGRGGGVEDVEGADFLVRVLREAREHLAAPARQVSSPGPLTLQLSSSFLVP